MKFNFLFALVALLSFGCSSETEPLEEVSSESGLYFPPFQSAEWESVSPIDLGWKTENEQALFDLLEEKGTKAFIILKDGKIAIEWYFGDHTQNTSWYWASAGKTLTSFTVGIAQEQGFLNISNKTSDYLGNGWTSASLDQENRITIKNQLTMTSGLNDLEFDCVTADCLEYVANAGTRWAYHNGPYTLLQQVVSNASNSDWSTYFNENLRDKIGMDGFWFSTNGQNNVFFSSARSMARFGLLNLNNGVWDGEIILSDTNYISDTKNTSQSLNKSYGYLWWLNGKDGYMLPALQTQFNGSLISNAPSDTYAGLGKNDQKLYIVPSENLVVIRMGENANDSLLATSAFDNELWSSISDFIN